MKTARANESGGAGEAEEALLYEKLAGRKVRCELCSRYCTIADGALGWCACRENRGGTLYSLTYGKSTGFAIDPIEKKPFFHFKPGTRSLSFGTPGCNFHCLNCQNWFMSQAPKEAERAFDIPSTVPEKVARMAMGADGVAYTYSEPTIFFEYARDCVLETRKLEEKEGAPKKDARYHVFVTNGYFSKECFDAVEKEHLIDAMRMDLKGFNEKFYQKTCGASLEPVLESIKRVHKSKMHLEIISLIIPTLNDQKEEIRAMSKWVAGLSKDIPLHFIRFFPYYKLSHLPQTEEKTLLKAREIAREEGLKYVYIGNTLLEGVEDTRCPKCGELLVARSALQVTLNKIEDEKNPRCPACGTKIPIVF
jgi:pyruvate formate lyase activating enzyme